MTIFQDLAVNKILIVNQLLAGNHDADEKAAIVDSIIGCYRTNPGEIHRKLCSKRFFKSFYWAAAPHKAGHVDGFLHLRNISGGTISNTAPPKLIGYFTFLPIKNVYP